MNLRTVLKAFFAFTFVSASSAGHAFDWRGSLSSELIFYPESSVGVNNWRVSSSLGAEVELTQDLTDNISLTVTPYARLDQRDQDRTRLELREFLFTGSGDSWEFNAGLGTVFWGVTESENPVDIINQTDSIEDLDDDEKLGQLMLNFNWFSDYGDFLAYALPRFKNRTFTGVEGRPFPGISVNSALTSFESSRGDENVDFALRWAYSFDAWDVGLHYFNGTSRDPVLIPVVVDTTPFLAPRYQLLRQIGVDAQGLYGDLAIKAEIVRQSGDELDTHIELVTGIEYTLVGLLSGLQDNEIIPEAWCLPDSGNLLKKLACNDRIDLGLVVEYLWDERANDSTQPFQNDLLAGLRFAFNDAATSDALIGAIQDFDGGATSLSVEASTRLFESYRLSLLARGIFNSDGDTFLNGFENENFFQLDLSYFF